ncbi:MAG: 16S rRNA (uracil(1498)-N(3))-methyltransferase [Thermaurantiacus sp.]
MRQIPRLFVDFELSGDLVAPLAPAQTHYLATVLRLQPGAELRLLDDRTGEWAAIIERVGRRETTVRVGAMIRGREQVPDLWLLAAPIRPERFAWVVEKATEMGVARVVPVLTERTQHARQKHDRLRAHMLEAAEQCGRTALPQLDEPVKLADMLAAWGAGRALLFADEEGGAPMPDAAAPPPAAILIGPEGGFSPAERKNLMSMPMAQRLSLGPRILRADTAAVAALAQWQMAIRKALAEGEGGR